MRDFIAQFIGGVQMRTYPDYWVFSVAVAPFARVALPVLILFALAVRVLS
jgi:hypothetical protein